MPGPARAPRRVVVVGAGAAGLQAAIAAAAARATASSSSRPGRVPGGQVREAASVPSRAEFGDLVRNQVAEAARLGVGVRYGITADVAAVPGPGARCGGRGHRRAA